jgi:hypothetical protein
LLLAPVIGVVVYIGLATSVVLAVHRVVAQ